MRSLFALVGRVLLAALLLVHPCAGPMMAGAAPANECCGSPAEPTPHTCCCDAAASISGGVEMVAVCCDAGELPPFVPAPATQYRHSFERVDIAVAPWAVAPQWPVALRLDQRAFEFKSASPPATGPRRHLRVHVLLI